LCNAHFQSRRAMADLDGRRALDHAEWVTLPKEDLDPRSLMPSLKRSRHALSGHADLLTGLMMDVRWKMPSQRLHLCLALVHLQIAMRPAAI
jgi:hypothetical protein